MNCPFCNYEETRVVDSREAKDGRAIRRRRECEKCRARFSTYEEIEIMRLSVIKKNGEREDYNQEKIKAGVWKALEKRPIKEDRVIKLLGDIEYDINNKAKRTGEIATKDIGRIILEELKEIDDVAYLRFASVYKSFGSAESFKKELAKMKDEKKK